MDAKRFEDLLRSLAASPSRRRFASVVAGFLLVGPLASLSELSNAQAKKKRKKKKKKKCKGGTKKCGKKCISASSCCSSADCGSGGTCSSGACSCAAGFQLCQGTCISDDTCCADDVKNGDETDVDCGGGVCPRCENDKICESRDDCASAYCPFNVPRVCAECPTIDTVCDNDDDGQCVCDLTVQGQKVCDKTLPETPANSCDECPAGTNCVALETFVNCYKPCGAS